MQPYGIRNDPRDWAYEVARNSTLSFRARLVLLAMACKQERDKYVGAEHEGVHEFELCSDTGLLSSTARKALEELERAELVRRQAWAPCVWELPPAARLRNAIEEQEGTENE